MTQSFINPLSKFTSDTLKTLPYSRLYFYENQSSTPKEVWKDKTKAVSWGYFAESDSAGNFAPIWFDGVARAELRYSPNWLTTPVGTVQTGWPIDWIGTAQTFDSDITVAGDVTAENIISTGAVKAAGNSGFTSTTYTLNARNPIWSFGNATSYGMSYFAGTPSIGSATDAIGFHFGAATLIGSKFTFNSLGDFTAAGDIYGELITARGDLEVDGGAFINGGVQIDNGLTVTAGATVLTEGANFGNVARAGSTVLDWYQEGTFTPTLGGTTLDGATTYNYNEGTFTQIGNIMHVHMRLSWSATTATGAILIKGLPKAFAASGQTSTPFSVISSGLVYGAGLQLGAQSNSGTALMLMASDPAGAAVTNVAIDATVASLNITGFYFV